MKKFNNLMQSWNSRVVFLFAILIILSQSNAFAARCNAEFKVKHTRSNASLISFKAKQHASATTSFVWNFGDNTTDTVAAPSHLFTNPGTYNVCLTVTTKNSIGDTLCSETHCDSVHVFAPVAPVCNANFKDKQIKASLAVKFKAKSHPHGASYSWSFGDGNSAVSTSKKVTHIYTSPGSYNVCLTITDYVNGVIHCQSTWCDSVYVIAPPPPICNANFTAKQDRSSFEIEVKGARNSFGTTYSWNFGDGTIVNSSTKNNSHTYAAAGTYNVCLTVTYSSAGIIYCQTTWCDSVNVLLPPAVCNADFSSHHHGNSLKEEFKAKHNPHGTIYSWSFGDGDTSNARKPVHTYSTAASYQVCLTVTVLDTANNIVCTDTHCDSIYAGSYQFDSDRDPIYSGAVPNASLYPNPVTEHAILNIENMEGAVSFIVFDNTGRQVIELNNLENGTFTLNKEMLTAGFYLYRVTDSKKNVVDGKLIIQ